MTARILLVLGGSLLLALLLQSCATGKLHKSRYCGPNAGPRVFREREIVADGVSLHAHEAGQGEPPLVLVHGFGGTSYSWRKLIEPLARRHRVFTYDLPGHGYSDKPEGYDYSAVHLGSVLLEILEREGLEGAVLVGNSYGGVVSLSALLHAQDRDGVSQGLVKKLVLIDSAGYPQKLPFHVGVLRWPIGKYVLPVLVPPRLMIRLIVRDMYARKEKVEKEQVREYCNALLTKGTRRAYREYAKVVLPKDAEERVKRYREIHVPTLIIHGKKDRVVPPWVAERFHEDIPGSRLVWIEEAGHIPQEEIPEEVLTPLVEFLGEELRAAS